MSGVAVRSAVGGTTSLTHTTEFEISNRYGRHLKMMQRLPKALASAMGNTVSVAVFDTMEEVQEFFSYTLEKKHETTGSDL